MRTTLFSATLLLMPMLAVAVGCGGEATTAIPESISLDQEQELQQAQKSVDEQERAYRQSQGLR